MIEFDIKDYKIDQTISKDLRMESWLRTCYQEATRSPDPSTQVGSLIVVSQMLQIITCNRFTNGWLPTESDLERPRKYQIMEHAERRAIYIAARKGIPLNRSTLVSTWAACADCARAIVESGIRQLIRHVPPEDDPVARWLDSVSVGDEIMKAGNIDIVDVQGVIPDAPNVLRGGKLFSPSTFEYIKE